MAHLRCLFYNYFFVCPDQTIICWQQTMVCPDQTMVCRQQTKSFYIFEASKSRQTRAICPSRNFVNLTSISIIQEFRPLLTHFIAHRKPPMRTIFCTPHQKKCIFGKVLKQKKIVHSTFASIFAAEQVQHFNYAYEENHHLFSALDAGATASGIGRSATGAQVGKTQSYSARNATGATRAAAEADRA